MTHHPEVRKSSHDRLRSDRSKESEDRSRRRSRVGPQASENVNKTNGQQDGKHKPSGQNRTVQPTPTATKQLVDKSVDPAVSDDSEENPYPDRVVTDIPFIPRSTLSSVKLWPDGPGGLPDYKLLQTWLAREGKLDIADGTELFRRAAEIMSREPNVISVNDPVTVVGDVHGQYYDLLHLLELGGGFDNNNRYLFLGDYVDRGIYGCEVVLLLCALKINYPTQLFMLRGNHECEQMTRSFNYKEEAIGKYGLQFFQCCKNFFNSMPLAAVINRRFFAVHGGISPDVASWTAINSVNRFQEPPTSGMVCDLLWADPAPEDGKIVGGDAFLPNDVRGCSYFFTYKASKSFLETNALLSIIRAHEAQTEGYKMYKYDPTAHFPTVITIFSAPNYCDHYGNRAAILRFENNTLNIQQFNNAVKPYMLPGKLSLFEWAMPFVCTKVHHILGVFDPPPPSPGRREKKSSSRKRDSLTEPKDKDSLSMLMEIDNPEFIFMQKAGRIAVKLRWAARLFDQAYKHGAIGPANEEAIATRPIFKSKAQIDIDLLDDLESVQESGHKERDSACEETENISHSLTYSMRERLGRYFN